MENSRLVRAAVVQAAPVVFNRSATLNTLHDLVREAAAKGAGLVLFPEAFIPAYPWELTFGTRLGSRSDAGRKVWQLYADNAVEVPGPETDTLSEAAGDLGLYLSVGIVERQLGSLYCTQLFFGPGTGLLGKHRKIKPTAAERLIWGEGDGTTLTTFQTDIGRIGGLICWENYMPLARMSMYNKGVEIYLAPTADHRDSWQITLRHIAVEGGCFVLGCNQYITLNMYPDEILELEGIEKSDRVLCRGGSVVIDPFGTVLAGPLWDREDILLADIDLHQITRRKMDLDVAGHYSRPDIFELKVNGQPDIIKVNPGRKE